MDFEKAFVVAFPPEKAVFNTIHKAGEILISYIPSITRMS